MLDVSTLIMMSVPSVAIVLSITEIFKRANIVEKRFLPFVSVGAGILFGVLTVPLSGQDFYTMAIVGLIAGLTASGTFDGAKALNHVPKEEKKEDDI